MKIFAITIKVRIIKINSFMKYMYCFESPSSVASMFFLGTAGPKVQTQARQDIQNDLTNQNDGLLGKIKKAIFG